MRLLDEGRIARAELEVRLAPEDWALLEEKVAPARWYPMDAYVRLVDVLVEREGAGVPEAYLFQRGVRAAERLSAAGIYQQLDVSREKTERMGPRVGAVIASVAGAIYNFTRWRFVDDEDGEGFAIQVENAEAFPNVARYTAEGFIHYVASRASGRAVRLWSERPASDRVVFRARLES